MNDWTSGYVADIDYTYGYYVELNPQRVKLAFLNAGLVAPEFGNACELGFGQGLSVNMHAAASVCSWRGTDFNPSQAGFAQELLAASGVAAHLYDEAFSEFAQRDMPEFDYIGLHGIWSWISDENRGVIVDFIRRKLKVGGVLYISYNTLPGWSAFAPMRHLMTLHAETSGGEGDGIVSRIDEALNFIEQLLETNPQFARTNPIVSEKIKQIKGKDRHYLAHEYFNRDWHPMHFGTLAKWLEPAKVTYACSANYLDHVDMVNLTTEQQVFLKNIHDPILKQTVNDFMVNQQFRRDYWVKGARRLTQLDQAEGLRGQRFLMTAYCPGVTLKITGALGEAKLTENIYVPLLDLMSDHKIRTLSEIEFALKGSSITFAQLTQAVLVLCGNGTLCAVQADTTTKKAKVHTDLLNNHILYKARSSNEINYLASPVTGGGINVGRFEQLFMLAIQQGKKKPEEWAAYVVHLLFLQGQRMLKEGDPLDSQEEHMVELTNRAQDFAVKLLPILKALQIA